MLVRGSAQNAVVGPRRLHPITKLLQNSQNDVGPFSQLPQRTVVRGKCSSAANLGFFYLIACDRLVVKL